MNAPTKAAIDDLRGPIARSMWSIVGIAMAIVFHLGACNASVPAADERGASGPRPPSRPDSADASADPSASSEPATTPPPRRDDALPTRFADAPRIVGIGDVHGDLAATRAALRLAGAIGEDSDDWIGGALVVVQTGDQLDRGDDERAIFALLSTLSTQAAAAGGALHVLNGNHELMNAAGDLRYVTEGGLTEFRGVEGLDLEAPAIAAMPVEVRARAAAFAPGGPYAKILAQRNTVVIVGRTVFVHGGVLPRHVPRGVPDLEQLNADVRQWLGGKHPDPRGVLATIMGPEAVVWTRLYAGETPEVCQTLTQTLNLLDVDRMVVGHTVQQGGVTSGCDGKVWRIDVGMAKHYGGRPAVLIIEGDAVRAHAG